MSKKDVKVLGIVPARGGSKGIRKKNIRLLGGKPLIGYTFNEAKKSGRLDRIILSTDDMEIADIGRRSGVEVPFMRPKRFARDRSPAREYIAHCLKFLEDGGSYRPGITVILQPTAPFRTNRDIDKCVDMLLCSPVDSVVSVAAIPRQYNPAWQMVVNKDGSIVPFTGIPWDKVAKARQDLGITYVRNGAVYAFRTEVFVKTGSIFGKRTLAYIMPEERSVNIDDMDDWRKAEYMIRKKGKRAI
ncbi:MAG: acylneuraminate cytidylyltransferase family protein [Candidatus Omnitrophica bacterium]|nr:acylneuraminate cytidylyltransferase family protein [Candidatus Omnitrophota bacterium]